MTTVVSYGFLLWDGLSEAVKSDYAAVKERLKVALGRDG